MQRPYREMLVEQEKKANFRNSILSLFELMLILAFFIEGEIEDLPASRLLTLLVSFMIYRSYHENTKRAHRSLLYFDSQACYFAAAKENDVERMKRFLELRLLQNLNCVDPDTGKNALHFAVSTPAMEAINFLVVGDKEVSKMEELKHLISLFNQQDHQGNTPLHDALHAVIAGKAGFELITDLIKGDNNNFSGFYTQKLPTCNPRIEIDIQNDQGESIKDLLGVVFRQAAQQNKVAVMKQLLSLIGLKHLNLYGSKTGRNALHFAVRAKSLEAINFLIAADQDMNENLALTKNKSIVNHQDNQGNTPIHEALIELTKSKNPNFAVLFAMLEIKGQNSLPNLRINSTIKNSAGETIVDLIDKVADSPLKIKAKKLIEGIHKNMTAKFEQFLPPNDDVTSSKPVASLS